VEIQIIEALTKGEAVSCQSAKLTLLYLTPCHVDVTELAGHLRRNANCFYSVIIYEALMNDNSVDNRNSLTPRKKWPHLKNGLKQTCPKCGDAPLFKAYLQPVDSCTSCHQDWNKTRAELAPAWAAMTIAAHIVILIYHFFIFGSSWPDWLQISILIALAVIICLATLPRMKGLFMAIIWLTGADDS